MLGWAANWCVNGGGRLWPRDQSRSLKFSSKKVSPFCFFFWCSVGWEILNTAQYIANRHQKILINSSFIYPKWWEREREREVWWCVNHSLPSTTLTDTPLFPLPPTNNRFQSKLQKWQQMCRNPLKNWSNIT